MRRVVTFSALVLFLAVLIVPTLRNYLQQRSQIESLNDQVAAQQQRVGALQRERDLWANPDYVRQQARQRLGFASPGERPYIVIDDKGTKRPVPAPAPGVDGSAARSDHPWYGKVWESVKRSGGGVPGR